MMSRIPIPRYLYNFKCYTALRRTLFLKLIGFISSVFPDSFSYTFLQPGGSNDNNPLYLKKLQ